MSKRYPAKNPQSGFKPVKLVARSDGQIGLIRTIRENQITIVSGSPGSGKTFISAGCAVQALRSNKVEKIILCRPIIGTDEGLGFLPGDEIEKMSPWLRPLFDELGHFMENGKRKSLIAEDVIEIAPLSMMRGRTFNNCFVICDEAQNASEKQLRMILTRLGQGSTMVLAGDILQSDLRGANAFGNLFRQLAGIEGIGLVRLGPKDVVRNSLIISIEERLCSHEDSPTNLSNPTPTSLSPGDQLGTLLTSEPTPD